MSAHFSAGLGLLRRNQAKRAGSRFLLTRLEKHTTLEGHGGCVNTTKFTNDGNLVITGSDDTNIKLWDWRTGECLLTMETLHTGNIFQATQLLHSSDSIVSCAADGQVQIHSLVHSEKSSRWTNSKDQSIVLGYHAGRVHKISLNPVDPHSFLSCGEDGLCLTYDVRTNESRFAVKFLNESGKRVPINSVNHDPLSMGNRFALAGSDKYVRIYDYRFLREGEPWHKCAMPGVPRLRYITCLDYSYRGELLATYSDSYIYLFPKVEPTEAANADSSPSPDSSGQRYAGHINCQTVKGVTFFGPDHEFVASGSDCGHCFVWDKTTADLLTMFKADENILNCVEPHPHESMTLATSGLEHNCKIWQPTADSSTVPDDMEDLVREQQIEAFGEGREWHQQATSILYAIMNNVGLDLDDDQARNRTQRFVLDILSGDADNLAPWHRSAPGDDDTDGDFEMEDLA